MGILVNVLRTADGIDCTNGGVSSRVSKFTVVNAEGPFDPHCAAPAVRIVKGPMNSVRLVPVDLDDSGKWVMFGGNFATTSDSRFERAVKDITGLSVDVVKIFDRVE